MELDHLICEAVKGHTRHNPQNLVGILAHIDCLQWLVPTYDELAGALQRLSDRKFILEIARHRFIENTDPAVLCTFSGYSYREHQQVYRDYDQWRQQQSADGRKNTLPAYGFNRHFVTVRWNRGQLCEHRKHHERAYIDDLAQNIDFLLQHRELGKVDGPDFNPGFADIYVFGRETDTDIDEMHKVIEKAIEESHWPSCSEIVRI
jgi:hypothetical protein